MEAWWISPRTIKVDRRFWSEALRLQAGMYVYLPPASIPKRALSAHDLAPPAFLQDERTFLESVPVFDRAIASGMLPPMIVAAPDGSIRGRPPFSTWEASTSTAMRAASRITLPSMCGMSWSPTSHSPERGSPYPGRWINGAMAPTYLAIKHADRFKVVAGFSSTAEYALSQLPRALLRELRSQLHRLVERYGLSPAWVSSTE